MAEKRDEVVLVDTSAAIALIVADHDAHTSTWEALADRQLGLSGHAWFETFSVLTRLPGTNRRNAAAVSKLLSTNFPHTLFLDEPTATSLATRLAETGISGGAVYDALVAAVAAHHGLVLASRDRRANDTYRAIGAIVEFLD